MLQTRITARIIEIQLVEFQKLVIRVFKLNHRYMTSSLFTQRFLLELGLLHGRVDNQIAGLQIDFCLPVWNIFIFRTKLLEKKFSLMLT